MDDYVDEAQEDSKNDTDRELMERILANQYLIRDMLKEILGDTEREDDEDLDDEDDDLGI